MNPPDISRFLSKEIYPQRVLRKLYKSNRRLTIFDIGACEGEDSIRYSRLFLNSQIYTFEPLLSNQNLIKENFKRFDCKNAKIVGSAVCERDGETEFHVSEGRPPYLWEGEDWNYGNKSSSILPPSKSEPLYGWLEFKKKVSVPCITLDTFCTNNVINHVDFIHMDVQGAELLALKGAKNILKKTAAIWLEVSEVENYKGQAKRTLVQEYLKKNGFRLIYFENRGEEGDQFYVNVRFKCVKIFLIKRFLYQLRLKVSALNKSIKNIAKTSPFKISS